MYTIEHLYLGIAVCVGYLFVVLRQRRYRMVLPCTIYVFTWLVTFTLMTLELHHVVGNHWNSYSYDKVVPYALGMLVAAIVGFTTAHVYASAKLRRRVVEPYIPIDTVDVFLQRFQWVLWVCLAVGVVQTYYFVQLGGFDSYAEYRSVALWSERIGYMAWVARISGHTTIFGAMYLSMLGYRHGATEINLRQFFKCLLLFAAVNMSIGGRVWVVAALLPYVTGYLLAKNLSTGRGSSRDKVKLLGLSLTIVSLFAILGMARGRHESGGFAGFIGKFLYYTDGPKMANMVLEQYPTGSYKLEWGASEFLGQWVKSPLIEQFKASLSHNLGLLYTVRSCIPSLYADFGYWGGFVAWGVLCFVLEMLCLRLMYARSFLCVMVFCYLARLLYETPVGAPITFAMPVFEWMVLIFLFRNVIFRGFPRQHI